MQHLQIHIISIYNKICISNFPNLTDWIVFGEHDAFFFKMAEWDFELYNWQNDDVMITRWKSSWSSIIRSMWDPSLKVSNSSEASTLKDGVKLNKPKIILWIVRENSLTLTRWWMSVVKNIWPCDLVFRCQ